MTKDWKIDCNKWLNDLVDEIRSAQQINDIANYSKKIILNNPNLSQNDFFWFIDNSFITNIIIRILKILGGERSYSSDTDFKTFLTTLQKYPNNVKSKEEFIDFQLSNEAEGYHWRKEKIIEEYINLTNNQSINECINADLIKIKEYRDIFNNYRNKLAHMKKEDIETDYSAVTFQKATETIEMLKELIRKYNRLIMGVYPYFPTEHCYHYKNVFDIPWRLGNKI